jgi:hypothetical protein
MRLLLDKESREARVEEIMSSLRSQLLYKERQHFDQGDYRYVIEALRPRKQRNARWLLAATLFFAAMWCLLVVSAFVYPSQDSVDRMSEALRRSQIGAGVLMVWGWRAVEKSKVDKLNEAERLLNLIEADIFPTSSA